MSKQDDPKFDFKAPEENVNKWEPKKWEAQAFQGVSPFDFAMRQKNEEKKRKEQERDVKARMYNYEGKGVASLGEMNAKKVNDENEKGKQAGRQQKEDAKRVNMAAAGFTVEQASRNADHARDQAWKETQKLEKESQKDVNMAAAGFGVEQASRNADHARDQAWKETQKMEKESQKDVNMAAAGFGVEQASRNADFEREKAWKDKQKEQKAKQAEFDMAKALF
jgi:hypothetical protein